MISKLTSGSSRAAISLTSGAMLPASLRTGTTMETAGGAPPLDVSVIFFPLERDDDSANHHPALRLCWSMIFFRKPVPTFRDHALGSCVRTGELYGAISARATLLTRAHEGPDIGRMRPSSP